MRKTPRMFGDPNKNLRQKNQNKKDLGDRNNKTHSKTQHNYLNQLHMISLLLILNNNLNNNLLISKKYNINRNIITFNNLKHTNNIRYTSKIK
jgi:hypothetical protein